MRLIYADEAGISAREPVCVVAAIIVHGDQQLRVLDAEISRIVRERVPQEILANFTEGFYIHATEIFSGSKKIVRELWPFSERVDFLKEIACLPFVYDVPIALGIDTKSVDWSKRIDLKSLGLKSSNQYSHFLAFAKCMDRADLFLRKYLDDKEVGTVICEDLPEMKSFLANFGLIYRDHPYTLEPEHLDLESWEIAAGIEKLSYTYEIRNIIDVPHFVAKRKAAMLQLADVCAFVFRHYLSRKPQGADLVMATLGPISGPVFVNEELWFGPGSSGLFNTGAYWSEEQRVAMQKSMRFQNEIVIRQALDMP